MIQRSTGPVPQYEKEMYTGRNRYGCNALCNETDEKIRVVRIKQTTVRRKIQEMMDGQRT